jgi:hypothetical protein
LAAIIQKSTIMKYLSLILMLIATQVLYSQKSDLKDVPKKASKIILTNELSKEDNLKYVIESLLDNDYTIAAKDDEYGTVKTDMRPLKGLNGSYFLTIRVKNNKIIITGKFTLNLSIDYGGVVSHPDLSEIVNKGMKGSPNKKSFEYMFEFARQLEFLKIEYEL